MSLFDIANIMKANMGQGGPAGADPVIGPPRQFTPGPMADVPYMPQVNIQPQMIQRYVDPNSPEMQMPIRTSALQDAMSQKAKPAPQPGAQGFWDRLLAGMQAMNAQRNPGWAQAAGLMGGQVPPQPQAQPQGMDPQMMQQMQQMIMQNPALRQKLMGAQQPMQIMGQTPDNFGMMG